MKLAVEGLLWMMVLGAGWSLVRDSGEAPREDWSVDLSTPTLPSPLDREVATAVEHRVVSRNPFRLNRRPAMVAFVADGPDAGSMPARTLPAIQVVGIVGGPPWRAVLQGVPGHRGEVVAHSGALFEELMVVVVRADSVILQLADTTWAIGWSGGLR